MRTLSFSLSLGAIGALGLLGVASCSKPEPAPAHPTTTTTTKAHPTEGGTAARGTIRKGAGNCPSTVYGAKTDVWMEGGAVMVSIHSADKDAVNGIQRRARRILALPRKGDAPVRHDQHGNGTGAIGMCPAYAGAQGTMTGSDVADGVVITIDPQGSSEHWTAILEGRAAESARWVAANIDPGDRGNQGAVGGGSGRHGSNHSGRGDGHGKQRNEQNQENKSDVEIEKSTGG